MDDLGVPPLKWKPPNRSLSRLYCFNAGVCLVGDQYQAPKNLTPGLKCQDDESLDVGLSENSVPLNPMVLLIIIPIKWPFVWEYPLFSDKPMYNHSQWSAAVKPLRDQQVPSLISALPSAQAETNSFTSKMDRFAAEFSTGNETNGVAKGLLGQSTSGSKSFNGHFRILNWRYLPYIRPI